MALSSCLGSLLVILAIWGNTVQASTAACRIQGDPHFHGFTPPMKGPAPYPCIFRMLSTDHFDMKDGDDAVVNIEARSGMATLDGRYFIDYGFFQMETTIAAVKTKIEYEITGDRMIQAFTGAISDPWIQVTNTTPSCYSSKVVASYDNSSRTASINVYDDSDTLVLVLQFVYHGKKLIVTVDASVQPPLSALFPRTLCSTFTDTTWGGVNTTGLTKQQIILFGLLSQGILNTDFECSIAAVIFGGFCAGNNERRDALTECDHFLNTDEAACLENAADGYLGGDAFKAFRMCIYAQPGCTNTVDPFYTTLLNRNCTN